jgi:hypothetical protein
MHLKPHVNTIGQWLQQVDEELLYTPDLPLPPPRRPRSWLAVGLSLFFLCVALLEGVVIVALFVGVPMPGAMHLARSALVACMSVGLLIFCGWPHCWLSLFTTYAAWLTVPPENVCEDE